MNYVHTAPEADFFDEKGLLKEYRPPVQQQQQQQQYQQMGGMFALRKIPISSSVSDPAPSPDFPFQEFPLTEVATESQIDYSSISDTSDPRENTNSSRKAAQSTDFPLKSGLDNRSHEEMRENRDPDVSTAPTQSSRDSNSISISDNSNPRKSILGIMNDTPTTFSMETDVALSNNRSVMPTDVQALTVLQGLLSDEAYTFYSKKGRR